jgi:hypothetical protein
MKSKDQILLENAVDTVSQRQLRTPTTIKKVINNQSNSYENYVKNDVPKILDSLKEFGVTFDQNTGIFSFGGKLKNIISTEAGNWKNNTKAKSLTVNSKFNNELESFDGVEVFFQTEEDAIRFLKNILTFL